jgi:hypothetical protein
MPAYSVHNRRVTGPRQEYGRALPVFSVRQAVVEVNQESLPDRENKSRSKKGFSCDFY